MNGYQHQGVHQPLREKSTSPLRSNDISQRTPMGSQHPSANVRQTHGFNYNDEEEEYERRRQEELRRQMGVPNQPLSDSYGFKSSGLTSPNQNQIPERDRSTGGATHFTLGPQMRQEPDVPQHVKEHISNIQNDNSSLMRRLNLVIQELERVNREKDEIFSRLKQSAKEASELQKLLNGEDNVDKVNKYMTDDLVYERDRNHKIKQDLKDIDVQRSDLIGELRREQDAQDEMQRDNQDLAQQLNQKMIAMEDLEKEQHFTIEKIRQLNNAIEILKNQLMDANSDKNELHRIVSQLMFERNDLLNRLEVSNRKYDECVREISHDRQEMERHNKQHVKLITAKNMFLTLNRSHKRRLQQGMSKIHDYSSFDTKCHQKLTNFARILEQCGHFRMKIGLQQWYSLAIQPLKTREQSNKLSIQGNNQRLKLRMFIHWRKIFDSQVKRYELKNLAIQRVWTIFNRDAHQEISRSFSIWKDTLSKFNLKKARVKKLLWKLYFNRIGLAMNQWQSHVNNIDNQVRLQLLTYEFSKKQYLTLIFNKFKFQVTEQRRKRQNILFHCLKGWQDHIKYERFIMASNVAALRFRENCNETIVKQCFDAIKLNRETEKYLRVDQILNEEELPMIQDLINENEDIEIQSIFKAKQRACECVKKQMSKQLYGIIEVWKNYVEYHKEKIRTTFKDRVLRVYNLKIRDAFNYWRTTISEIKLSEQQMIIDDYSQSATELQNEVLDLKKDVNQRKEQLDCSQQKHVLKCVTSYQKRMKQLAIGRWRDQIQTMNLREDGADTIIQRLRKRFLRKAFDLYLAGVKYQKKLETDEERCALYNKTRNERIKKQTYRAWDLFRENHKRAKKYWQRCYLRLDLGMKEMAIKKWRDQTQRKVEREMRDRQNQVVENIEELNHQLGELHQDETKQQQDIHNIKNQMTQQARRIISNAFARFYYTNEARGFERWRDYVQDEKKKEKILRRFIEHMRKYKFNMVKSCLQNWIMNSKIQEKMELIKKEELRLRDSGQQVDIQGKTFDGIINNLSDEIDQTKKLQDMYNSRLQKTVQMIVNRVDTKDYMSQKRYILTQWRNYVKREVTFLNCVQNVIQKSLWNQAFIKIREFSRNGNQDDNKEKILNRFRQKFWKRTCGSAFSQWRSGLFSSTVMELEELDSNNNQQIEEYQQKKALFKDVNSNRSERIIEKNHLKNVYNSWKNVTQLFKLQNAKNDEFQEQSLYLQKKLAIFKWNSRVNATRLARIRSKKLREKVQQIRLRQYFYALRVQFSNVKEFCSRLSNLARVHDHQGLKLSLNAIKSFAKSKQFVFETRKHNSTKSIEQILTNLIAKKKQQYLNDLRIRSLSSRKSHLIKSFTILHNLSNKLRFHFIKWKEGAAEKTLALEMHEEGPIREQVFEAKARFMNIKMLMKDEGYDEKDIADAIKEERGRQSNMILKGLRRMQNYDEENYTKPMVLDKWKKFVHARKLFKYWLGFVSKRGEYVKTDLHFAFDKWKEYQPDQKHNLTRMKKMQLNKRTLQNNRDLDKLAELVEDKENELDHMNLQREALVENYVKGQKMALSLWVSYRKRLLHQGMIKWFETVRTIKNAEYYDNLRKNMDKIDALKQRIMNLENDNQILANENEDLRQFSIDGYEIAKNVQVLTNEREKLSVDLADKAQVIRKLLDENEKLTSKLRYAQDEAQNLIKSTLTGSKGFKSGKKNPSSPYY